MKLISREKALEKGLPRYFTGIPCNNNHIAERIVATWKCLDCAKVINKRCRDKNKEKYKIINKIWREKNKESLKEKTKIYGKIWRERNKEKLSLKGKQDYLKNKEEINRKHRENYHKTKEQRQKKIKEWYQNNLDKAKELNRNWYFKNKEKRAKQIKEYYQIPKNAKRKREIKKIWRQKNAERINDQTRQRKKDNPHLLMACRLRARVRQALRQNSMAKKTNTTLKLVGLKSWQDLWKHLEKQFEKGMSKKNMNKWHIDHIKPCASFDLSKVSEQKKCFNYKNLQPLWAVDNLRKGAKLI